MPISATPKSNRRLSSIEQTETIMNRRLVLSAFVVSAALVAASVTALPARADDDLVIGLSMNRTGPLAANGTTNDVAVQMAVEEINAKGGVNGKKLKVAVFDTAGDPKQAVVATRRFAEDDKALAIIGPFSSGECRVAFPVGERLGIVQISNASSAPGLTAGFKFAFRNTSDELIQFQRLLKVMGGKSLLPKSAAVIYATDEFVSKTLGTAVFPAALKEANVPVAVSVGFPLQAFDLSPQVAELKRTNAEAVAIGGTVEAVVKIVREMRRQGVESRVLTSGVAADPQLAEKLGRDGNGTLYPTYYFHKLDDRVLAFQQRFGEKTKAQGFSKTIPQHADVSAYDIVYLLAEAMRRAQLTGTASKLADERIAIRDQLLGTKSWSFEGVIGREYFGADGDARMPTYVVELQDGDFKLLETVNPE
jgi:branched-chain amino acid transport system substrate-binding protein